MELNSKGEQDIMRTAILVGLALILSACVSREDLLNRDRQTCAEIGFSPGSQRYQDCILQMQSARLSDHAGHHHH